MQGPAALAGPLQPHQEPGGVVWRAVEGTRVWTPSFVTCFRAPSRGMTLKPLGNKGEALLAAIWCCWNGRAKTRTKSEMKRFHWRGGKVRVCNQHRRCYTYIRDDGH